MAYRGAEAARSGQGDLTHMLKGQASFAWEQNAVRMDLEGRVETGHFQSAFPLQRIGAYIKLLGSQKESMTPKRGNDWQLSKDTKPRIKANHHRSTALGRTFRSSPCSLSL